MDASFIKRFEKKFITRTDTECWEWIGAKTSQGYGYMRKDGTVIKSHRIACYLKTGEWGEFACHTCDNRICVNPHHLWWGSNADNMRDKEEKGRGNHAQGEKQGSAKLTAEQVLKIRTKYTGKHGEQMALAKEYNVYYTTINKIIKRESWKHI